MSNPIGERQLARINAVERRQCAATNRSGQRCGKPPIIGGFVCEMHGGKIPTAQRAAKERLLAMVEPALDALLRFLRSAPPCEHCGRSDADRDPTVLRAAQLVLDRTGFHPTLQVEVAPANPFADLTEDELIDRLESLLAAAKQQRALREAHTAPLLLSAIAVGVPVPDADAPIPVSNENTEAGTDAD